MSSDHVDLLLVTEVTLFFERNPFVIETDEGLARKLGRRVDHVQRTLEHLVDCQILVQQGGAAFAYISPYLSKAL